MANREDGYVVREVVRNLLADVKEFQSDARGEIAKISSCADSLGDAWNDPQYQQFKAYIEDLTSALNRDLDVLEEAVVALNKEL